MYDHHVRWLQISVNETTLMRMMHGLANVDENSQTSLERYCVVAKEVVDALAIHPLHYQVRYSAIGESSV